MTSFDFANDFSDTSLLDIRSRIYKNCKEISKNINRRKRIRKIFDILIFLYNLFLFVLVTSFYYKNHVPGIWTIALFLINLFAFAAQFKLRWRKREWVENSLLINLDEIAVQITIEMEKPASKRGQNPDLDKMITYYLQKFGGIKTD